MNLPGWWRVEAAWGALRSWWREDLLVYELPAVAHGDDAVAELHDPVAPGVGMPYGLETQASHRAAGWTLYALQDAGTQVSFAWARVASVHRVSELGRVVEAAGPIGWVVHCVTPEEHRGRGYYSRLIGALAARLAPRRTLIYTLASNTASRRGIEKAGGVPVGVLTRRLGRVRSLVPLLRIGS